MGIEIEGLGRGGGRSDIQSREGGGGVRRKQGAGDEEWKGEEEKNGLSSKGGGAPSSVPTTPTVLQPLVLALDLVATPVDGDNRRQWGAADCEPGFQKMQHI